MSAEAQGRRHAWLTIYRALSDAAAKAVMFAVTVAAARRLPRDAFALFAVGTTLGWMAAVAADAGLQAHVARLVARRPADARHTARRWLPVRGGAALLSLAVGLALLPAFDAGPSARPALAMIVAAYAAAGLSEWIHHVWRGLGRTDVESSLTLLHRLVLGITAAIALTFQPALESLALALLAAGVVALLAAGATLLRLPAAAEVALPAGPAAPRAGEFAREVLPIGLGVFVSALYFRVDVLLLERWGSNADVAHYAAVFRVVEALRLLPAAVLAVALPALCRAPDRTAVTRLATWLTGGALGITVLLWPLAGVIVERVYGAAFADAAAPLRILLLAWPAMALNYALTTQLIAWDGHRAYLAIALAALCCNLALNWWWIPASGMVGAAWSTLATEGVLTLGCGLALRRPSGAPLTATAQAAAGVR